MNLQLPNSVENCINNHTRINIGEKGVLVFPNDGFLDSSKLKEFAYDNYEFDENGRKVSKQVENIVDKAEMAHYEQFLLF